MRLKSGLEAALLVVTSAMLAFMVCLMLWQVFSRYVLATPALFTEELLRFTMIWMAFLGAAYAFGTRRHLSLVFLVEIMTGRRKMMLMMFNDLVILLFAGIIMFLGGLRAVSSTMEQFSPILRWPIGDVYRIMPITALLIVALQLLNMIELYRSYRSGALDAPRSEET
ncbi:MAG: TRAP transporter small permease [Tropicimonas sp.]|uniref:TRAP transporter small permease n=1 Tax=Tropicimonas sp. TaxID=2067044 RepID=UPI003A8669B7